MTNQHLKEVDFLVSYAVNKFNQQFNKRFDYKGFAVHQIEEGSRHHRAYELYTLKDNDYLRLRIYIRFGRFDDLKNYRVEVEENLYNPSGLEDEVHVAEGTISKSWIDNGIYRFRKMTDVSVPGDYILSETGVHIFDEDGDYILLEDFTK